MIASPQTRRRRWTFVPLLGIAAVTLAASACGDDDDDVLITEPVNVTVTAAFRDPNFNFQTLKTFAMPDTVVQFAPLTGQPLAVSRAFDQTILNQVRADLIARGYVQVADPRTTTPSFVVLVGTTATENYNAFVSYPWFGVWGFYPGWGFYAPGFDTSWGIVFPYANVGITSIARGSLVIDIIPTATVNPLGRTVSAAWTGLATTLLNGTTTNATVAAAIDEIFAKSPYLVAGP